MKLLRKVVPLILGTIASLSLAPAAFAATITPLNDVMYEWQVTSVGSPYNSYGSWNYGTSATNTSTDSTTLNFSKTEGYSNTVSGTNNVSDGTLSSSVGFSVTYTSSTLASYSMTLLPGQKGEIDWRDTYSSKNVTEEDYWKYVTGGTWQATGNYAYCTANEWIGFNYDAYNP